MRFCGAAVVLSGNASSSSGLLRGGCMLFRSGLARRWHSRLQEGRGLAHRARAGGARDGWHCVPSKGSSRRLRSHLRRARVGLGDRRRPLWGCGKGPGQVPPGLKSGWIGGRRCRLRLELLQELHLLLQYDVLWKRVLT